MVYKALSSTGGSASISGTYREVTFSLDGQGSALSSGGTWYLASVPFSGTITGWNLVADQSGSAAIDIWKANAAVPTVADSITGGSPPTLAAAQSAFAGSVAGWNTAVAINDVFAFHVTSAATLTKLSLTLQITIT